MVTRSGHLAALLGIVALAASALAWSASFGVRPMRVDLGPATPTAVLHVHNDGDRPVTLQARAYTWGQPDGTDVYEETRGFIISPPIFTIATGETQIIRIGQRQPFSGAVEQAYRFVIAEVPQADETLTGVAAVRIAIRMNIPMYVAPAIGQPAPQAEFVADFSGEGARLRVRNGGSAALRLADFTVDQEGARLARHDVFVILPGATRYVDLRTDDFRTGQPLRVHAHSNGGPVELVLQAIGP